MKKFKNKYGKQLKSDYRRELMVAWAGRFKLDWKEIDSFKTCYGVT